MMTNGLRFGLGAGLALGLLTAAHATDPLSLVTNHATVLAYTDGAVPGMPLFTTFGSQMNWPMLAEDNTVVFSSNLAGPTITAANSRAIFQGTTAADLSVVAQWSDAAPGLPGLSLINNAGTSGFGDGRISPDGRNFFVSRLTNAAHNLPTTSDTALFSGFAGSLALVAREGDAAPGTAGALFGEFLPASGEQPLSTQLTGINRNGRVMFYGPLVGGDVVGTTNHYAMYTGTPGALTIVVRLGDTMLPGITAAGLGQNLMVGDRILYHLQLAGAGVTSANDDALWLYTPGSGNALLLREGDPAPGTAGAVFSGAFSLTVNSVTTSGRFQFVESLSGGDVTAGANDQGIFIADTTGAVALLARKGSPAPGTDAVFRGFSPFYNHVNDAGFGAFQATLIGGTVNASNDNGIWGGTPGSLSLIARAGVTPIAGSNGSVCSQIIAEFMTSSDFGFVQLCRLSGPDVFPGHNSIAVFAWTPTKGPFLVFRQGQDLEVSPGVSRPQTQAAPTNYGNSDGAALGLTHTGKLGLRVSLDPGMGITSVDLNCYPTTDYYADADGDGHGDPATELNLCAGGVPPPGYIATSGDCLDSNPSAQGATTEICNGIDDDCNGRLDDGVPHPTGTLTMTMAKSAGNITASWNAVPNAIQYDIISGDLQELRSAGGHYTNLTQTQCFANDQAGTSMFTGPNPTPGNGQFFLMRAVGCTGLGNYDEGVPSQHSTRDQEIGTSLYSCPN